MQPDRLLGIPRRAMVAYVAVVFPLLFAAALVFGRWLDGLGVPWLLMLVAVAAALKALVQCAGLLSVPGIYWMVTRWPWLGRGRLLSTSRGGGDRP